MNLDTAFPAPSFTTTELVEIARMFNHPVIRKYLLVLQRDSIKDIANGLPKEGESAESYLLRQAQVVGALGAIETLLKIEAPAVSS